MNPSLPSSVADLATACTGKFNELLSLKDSDLEIPLQNRAADFQLWVDGVGAVARPGASLDSRFRDRPNDLLIIQGILVMLIDFLNEISTEGSLDTAFINVDSALGNLAMIGVAIRRTGKASRSRRADQSFNPAYYEDLRRHLECVILLRPTDDKLKDKGFDATKAIHSENLEVVASSLQEMASYRLGQLDGSNLTETQLRLIDNNLRRRHRFILAQKRSQHNKVVKATHQNTHREEPVFTEPEPEPEVAPRSRDHTTSAEKPLHEKEMQNLPEQKLQAPPTIAIMSTASTAEGTMRYDPKAKYVPTLAQSQISVIANETEFPKVSLPPEHRQIVECPCCCQPLPYDEVRKPTNWRQHLIEDICPYSCVAERCPTPQLLFATRKAWDMHIENDHPCQWKCVVCEQDEATFSNVGDITGHIQSFHQDDLSIQTLPDLKEWSRVQSMGIKSCPLCSSQGPEDSPELVDHVVRHAYEFALRSLPWPRIPVENLNKPVGAYSPPKDPEQAARLWNWLEEVDQTEQINVSSSFSWLEEAVSGGTQKTIMLSPFDHADHEVSITQSSLQEDYFESHAYFDQVSGAGSQLVTGAEVEDRGLSDQISEASSQPVTETKIEDTEPISTTDFTYALTEAEAEEIELSNQLWADNPQLLPKTEVVGEEASDQAWPLPNHARLLDIYRDTEYEGEIVGKEVFDQVSSSPIPYDTWLVEGYEHIDYESENVGKKAFDQASPPSATYDTWLVDNYGGTQDGADPPTRSSCELYDPVENSPVTEELWIKTQFIDLHQSLFQSGKLQKPRQIKIAVLDTGFAASQTQKESLGERVVWRDFVTPSNESVWKDEDDDFNVGRGTLVVSLLLKLVPEAKIYVCRVARHRRAYWRATIAVAKAIEWVAEPEQDVDIITLSFWLEFQTAPITQAINHAMDVKQRNLLIFAAAGSLEDGLENFPARFHHVISVRGAGLDGIPISNSRHSPRLRDRTSPMFCTLSQNVECGSGNPWLSGSFLATPILAATAALFLQYVCCINTWKQKAESSDEGGLEQWRIDALHQREVMVSLFQEIGKRSGEDMWFVQPRDLFQDSKKDFRSFPPKLKIVLNQIPKRTRKGRRGIQTISQFLRESENAD